MDVHKLSIAIAILDAYGKLVSRTVIETTTEAVRDFFRNLRGEIHLTFEEGNHAAWLYDIVEPLVKRVVACNPKQNRIEGSRSDRVDALKLAELPRLNGLKPVYHGEHGTRTLKHLMRSYECLVKEGNGDGEQEASGVLGVKHGSGTGAGTDSADHPDSGNALAVQEQAALLELCGLGGGDQKHSRS
jgi:hypothetical protein